VAEPTPQNQKPNARLPHSIATRKSFRRRGRPLLHVEHAFGYPELEERLALFGEKARGERALKWLRSASRSYFKFLITGDPFYSWTALLKIEIATELEGGPE
jgi:hypothetical protein